MTHELLLGVSSEGLPVAEAELGDGEPAAVVTEARRRGAALLWLHTDAELAGLGFRRTGGYVRLRAESAPAGEPLSQLSGADYVRTLDRAYRGLWGHKQVAADSAPPEGSVVLGLYEDGEPVGLCTVLPQERLVDGPGVVPEARTPARYARLLLGACATLGPGFVDVDSWGDSEDVLGAYQALGFAVAEQIGGWELRLS